MLSSETGSIVLTATSGNNRMHRLFVGLRPPTAIRTALIARMGGVPGARWQNDDQLHITLRFVGEVDGAVAEDVANVLGSVRSPAITVALSGAGRFDSRGRANSLWAGVKPVGPLAALHRKIDTAFVRVGLIPERRAYLPHVTLARLNAPLELADRFVVEHAGLTSDPFTLTYFELFESHLGRERATYETVARYALNG